MDKSLRFPIKGRVAIQLNFRLSKFFLERTKVTITAVRERKNLWLLLTNFEKQTNKWQCIEARQSFNRLYFAVLWELMIKNVGFFNCMSHHSHETAHRGIK